MKFYVLTACLLLAGGMASAQDSTGKKVKITSSFKPVLKEAAKINFNASPALTDTSRPRLQYNIPNQNLSFAFQPGTLRPLALAADTGTAWTNENYVKAGYGNFKSPFVQVGLSVGDGKNAGLNFYGRHNSAKGKLENQSFANTLADLSGYFKTGNVEWTARVGALQEKYKKYGYQPRTLVFPKDSLDVKLDTWRGRISFRNVNRTDLGISYAPEIRVDAFNDGLDNSEKNIYVNAPLQKSLGKTFAVDLAVTANISNYQKGNKVDTSNNWFAVSPSVLYKTANVNVQVGVRPSWDNAFFKLFPNIIAEVASSDKRFSFQAGWVGYLRNSGFQYQARINPYIWAPDRVYNSQIEERFAGIKGSAGDHFNFSVKLAFNRITNQPLFTNDTTAGGKSFRVINEPRLNVLNLGGELGYTVGERFSFISNLQVNQYSPKVADKAWGLLPVEWKNTLRLQVLKDLYVNSDLYFFNGPFYQTKGNGRGDVGSALDLSAGLEFKVYKSVKLWGQFNNLLNNEYQRWNQYPVLGLNVLAGVVFSFAQSK